MTKFIRLTSILINLADIQYIQKTDAKKYIITMRTQSFSGFMLLGSGYFSSNHNKMTICEKEHTNCYKLMDKWCNEN